MFVFRAHSYSKHAEVDGPLSALLDFGISTVMRALTLISEQHASSASLTHTQKQMFSFFQI